ncbi:MAG: PspC domain-containing protein [Chloroflexia bacterium]
MEAKRMMRSRTERMIGGVCGGLAEYFHMDPTIVRVIFVLLALVHGIGLILYLVLWFVMPEVPVTAPAAPAAPPPGEATEKEEAGEE